MSTDLFIADTNTDGTPFNRITNVGPVSGSESFLLECDSCTILFDSGFACSGDGLVANLENTLNGRDLDYIIISHSHYDHALGSAYCTARWPKAQVISSSYTKSVFARPGARNLMRHLNANASVQYNITSKEDLIDNLRVDITADDGDIIMLGDLEITAISFPGHTKCSYGFYIPKYKFLLGSETLGVYAGGDIVTPTFLVGFGVGVETIKKALAIDIQHMLIPHFGLIHGDKCHELLNLAIHWSRQQRTSICDAYSDGKSTKEMKYILRDMFLTPEQREFQPEEAFMINAEHIVAGILSEYCGVQH